jgi:hypothetical protein
MVTPSRAAAIRTLLAVGHLRGTDPPKSGPGHPAGGRSRVEPSTAMVPAVPRSPARASQESGPDDRSIVDTPRLGKLTARERRRVVTGTRVALDARTGHCPADLTPQAANLGPQRVELSPGDCHHLGCFALTCHSPPLDAAPPSLGCVWSDPRQPALWPSPPKQKLILPRRFRSSVAGAPLRSGSACQRSPTAFWKCSPSAAIKRTACGQPDSLLRRSGGAARAAEDQETATSRPWRLSGVR